MRLLKILSSGERVGFFRAEVERDRWLEQWEIKIAELLWCIRSFERYASTGLQLASMNRDKPGYEAYAQDKIHMYSCFTERGRREFENLGYKGALNRKERKTLQDFILAQRATYLENKKREEQMIGDEQ